MMKPSQKYLLLLLILPLFCGADINRVFITGNNLLEYCQQSSNFCFGYVTAVVDDTSITYGDASNYCLPADINAETLQQSVIDYMLAHPGQLELPGPDVVTLALIKSYPCQ